MNYILDTIYLNDNTKESIEELQASWKNYVNYLESIKHLVPLKVYEFATAEWHYSSTDNRSMHDSWLKSLSVNEIGKDRSLDICLDLLGPYHDVIIHLKYHNVSSYNLARSHSDVPSYIKNNHGHSDLLIDEINLSDSGMIVHKMRFRSGANWIIEFKSLDFSHEGIDK